MYQYSTYRYMTDTVHTGRYRYGIDYSIQEAIRKFSQDVSDWNKSHFGNIFDKKRMIMARLGEIQKALADSHLVSLVEFERKL